MLSLFFKHLGEKILLFVKRVKAVDGGTEDLWDHSAGGSGRGLKPAGASRLDTPEGNTLAPPSWLRLILRISASGMWGKFFYRSTYRLQPRTV